MTGPVFAVSCFISKSSIPSLNFSFVKSLPVIFISLIVCWSYYAYFVATLLTLVTDSAEQIVCGLIFHVVTALFVWSYYMIVFTPAGQAPDSWYCIIVKQLSFHSFTS